jgi:hypothetical protein
MTRHRLFLPVIAAVALIGSAGLAHAEKVSINGYFSRGQMQAQCAQVGGDYVEVTSGNETTYGCENEEAGSSAYCNTRTETCFGYVPDRPAGSRSISYASLAAVLAVHR